MIQKKAGGKEFIRIAPGMITTSAHAVTLEFRPRLIRENLQNFTAANYLDVSVRERTIFNGTKD